jgi:hypothetical protein
MLETYYKQKAALKQALLSKPEPEPVPHNAHLWQDVNRYFKELFTAKPDLQNRTYTVDLLKLDLFARFNGTYNDDELYRLCKVGYDEIRNGVFLFRRSDFILPKGK